MFKDFGNVGSYINNNDLDTLVNSGIYFALNASGYNNMPQGWNYMVIAVFTSFNQQYTMQMAMEMDLNQIAFRTVLRGVGNNWIFLS